jgi:hypothetical protein
MREVGIYRERTPFPLWSRALLWGSLIGTALAILFGSDAFDSLLTRLVAAMAVLAVGVVVYAVALGGLTVEVRSDEIALALGSGHVFRKRVPYEQIERLEAVRYRPLVEFGGWGVRGSKQRQAWTARGDRAVVLHLVDGRQLYVGSDHAQRLAERIRVTAGERFGG